jgi:hypothetical protein
MDLEVPFLLGDLEYLDHLDFHQDPESEHLVFLENLVILGAPVPPDYLNLEYLEHPENLD